MPDDHGSQPTQPTQPKKGEPVEIPVPKRETIDELLKRAAQPSDARRSGE
jgi:hypothetical protein